MSELLRFAFDPNVHFAIQNAGRELIPVAHNIASAVHALDHVTQGIQHFLTSERMEAINTGVERLHDGLEASESAEQVRKALIDTKKALGGSGVEREIITVATAIAVETKGVVRKAESGLEEEAGMIKGKIAAIINKTVEHAKKIAEPVIERVRHEAKETGEAVEALGMMGEHLKVHAKHIFNKDGHGAAEPKTELPVAKSVPIEETHKNQPHSNKQHHHHAAKTGHDFYARRARSKSLETVGLQETGDENNTARQVVASKEPIDFLAKKTEKTLEITHAQEAGTRFPLPTTPVRDKKNSSIKNDGKAA